MRRPSHLREPDTRIAVVGYGRRGRQWAAAAKRSGDVLVAGIVDPDPAARATAEAESLRAWASLDDALDAGVAACVVASPPALHFEQASRALEAGVGVLVEKPFATSVHQAETLAALAARSSRPALAAMNFRLRPVERAIRVGIERVGGASVSAIHSTRPLQHGSRDGALWDIGVHHLDLIAERAGAMPAGVSAESLPGAGGSTILHVRVEWLDGAIANWIHHEGGSLFHTYQWIEGPQGGVSADGDRVTLIPPSRRPRTLRGGRGPDPERSLLSRLSRALRTGEPDRFDAKRAIAGIALVEAVTIAIESGARVDPSNIPSRGRV